MMKDTVQVAARVIARGATQVVAVGGRVGAGMLGAAAGAALLLGVGLGYAYVKYHQRQVESTAQAMTDKLVACRTSKDCDVQQAIDQVRGLDDEVRRKITDKLLNDPRLEGPSVAALANCVHGNPLDCRLFEHPQQADSGSNSGGSTPSGDGGNPTAGSKAEPNSTAGGGGPSKSTGAGDGGTAGDSPGGGTPPNSTAGTGDSGGANPGSGSGGGNPPKTADGSRSGNNPPPGPGAGPASPPAPASSDGNPPDGGPGNIAANYPDCDAVYQALAVANNRLQELLQLARTNSVLTSSPGDPLSPAYAARAGGILVMRQIDQLEKAAKDKGCGTPVNNDPGGTMPPPQIPTDATPDCVTALQALANAENKLQVLLAWARFEGVTGEEPRGAIEREKVGTITSYGALQLREVDRRRDAANKACNTPPGPTQNASAPPTPTPPVTQAAAPASAPSACTQPPPPAYPPCSSFPGAKEYTCTRKKADGSPDPEYHCLYPDAVPEAARICGQASDPKYAGKWTEGGSPPPAAANAQCPTPPPKQYADLVPAPPTRSQPVAPTAGLGPPPQEQAATPMAGLGPPPPNPCAPSPASPSSPGTTAMPTPPVIPMPLSPPAPQPPTARYNPGNVCNPTPPAPPKPSNTCNPTPPALSKPGNICNPSTPSKAGTAGQQTAAVPPQNPQSPPIGRMNSGECHTVNGQTTCTDASGNTCTTTGGFCDPTAPQTTKTAAAPTPPKPNAGPLKLKPPTQMASGGNPCSQKTQNTSVPACSSKPPYLPWGGRGSATITVSGGQPCGVGWHDTPGGPGGVTVLDSMTVSSPPSHGTLRPQDQHVIIFTPAPGYKGQDSFILSMREHNGGRSATLSVTVSVTIQ